MKKIGFIGMGNMAGAIAGGIIKSGFVEGENVYAFDIDNDKLTKMHTDFSINVCTSEKELVAMADIVIIAVKPNVVLNPIIIHYTFHYRNQQQLK